MFIEKIKSDGLAHLSYLIGAGGYAAVIDPRRDCEVYIERARAQGCRVTHIFETHRNEDLVSGAPILAELTGATVYHGPNADAKVEYAKIAHEGERFKLGAARIEVLETPGHTYDSLCFALYDENFSAQDAVAVFTGDTLFVGDVGRTDFYPEQASKVAGLLFDSLRKLEKLGPQTIIYPAHGAGSVCGDNMADREFSTLGYERQNNAMFALADREDFIAKKLREQHDKPPYFKHMEELNLKGVQSIPRVLQPPPLPASEVNPEAAILLDVRGVSDFLGAHIPKSLAIPQEMLAAFAGWFLQPEDKIVLIANSGEQAENTARELARIAYDNVLGVYQQNLTTWAEDARAFRSVPVVNVETVSQRLAERSRDDWTLLDVRKDSEVENAKIEGSSHIFLGDLPHKINTLNKQREYTVMCASGARATIGASLLLRAGFNRVSVFLGSLGAWTEADKPVEA